jgi:hypothetical protein
MTKKKINSLSRGLFNNVSQKDTLREIAPGKLLFQDKILSPVERLDLISQAKTLKKLTLFNVLLDEIKFLSNKKIYLDSKNDFDILAGKMGLWFEEQMRIKVDAIARMK